MKILFVADPIDNLKPKGDSSLNLVRASLRRGHEVYWSNDSDVTLRDNRLSFRPQLVLECEQDLLPRLAAPTHLTPIQIDLIFIRKDPPFDANYVKLCWLLGLIEHEVEILNRPSVLLRHHEKMIPLQALAEGFLEERDLIPTFLGELKAGQDYISKHHEVAQIVTKPFLGFGGRGLHLFERTDFLDLDPHTPTELVQPFQKEVYEGDRRVFLLDGKILANFVRLPKAGGFVSNLAQGGSAVSRPLNTDQTAALERLGKYLKHAGITIAGADLIGAKISEVNITSPTGLQNLLALEKRDYGDDIIGFAEKHRLVRKP